VANIDAIMRAVYDVISGPAGQKRDWIRMRSLFTANARLMPKGGRGLGHQPGIGGEQRAHPDPVALLAGGPRNHVIDRAHDRIDVGHVGGIGGDVTNRDGDERAWLGRRGRGRGRLDRCRRGGTGRCRKGDCDGPDYILSPPKSGDVSE